MIVDRFLEKIVVHQLSDMIFVQLFTHPDFQAKNFTPVKSIICDIFYSQLNSVNAYI